MMHSIERAISVAAKHSPFFPATAESSFFIMGLDSIHMLDKRRVALQGFDLGTILSLHIVTQTQKNGYAA
jgi:predicted esterase